MSRHLFLAASTLPFIPMIASCDTEEPPFDGVTIQIVDTYRLASGEEIKRAASLDGVHVQILSDADRATPIEGKPSADGTSLQFAGVPEGAYWILEENPRTIKPAFPAPPLKVYHHISAGSAQRTIDMGAIIGGRPDLRNAATPTQVSVVAPSLAVPWQQYTLAPDGVTELQRNQDSVDVYAFNADAYASAGPADDDPNVPADQAKSFAGWTFDWSFVVNATNRGDGVRPLLDAGDDPILTHLVSTIVEDPALPSSDPWSSWTLATAADSGVIAPVTMADGSPAKLEATLTSGPSKSFALDLRGSAFAAEVTANGPAVVSSAALSFGSTREPGAPNPIYGNAPTLFDAFTFGFNEPANPTCYPDDMGMCDAMACPTGCDATAVFHFPGDLTRTIQYTDPYEAHGQELFGAVLTVRSFVTHPTTKKRVRLLSALDVAAPAADVAGKPIEPRMGFVRGITLGGKSAPVAAPTPGMGTSFEVKWSAPALGTPNAYFVRVIQWADTELPDAVNASSVVLALLRTRETSFVLPDGILESGHYYSISVRADDWFDELRPNLYTSPTLSSAELSTGLFTP